MGLADTLYRETLPALRRAIAAERDDAARAALRLEYDACSAALCGARAVEYAAEGEAGAAAEAVAAVASAAKVAP